MINERNSLFEQFRMAFFMRRVYIPSVAETIAYNIEKHCQRRCERYCFCENGIAEEVGACPIGTICRGPVILTEKNKQYISNFLQKRRIHE